MKNRMQEKKVQPKHKCYVYLKSFLFISMVELNHQRSAAIFTGISQFLLILRNTECVFVQVRLINACSYLVYNYSKIMFTHNTLHVLLISVTMATPELSVNT